MAVTGPPGQRWGALIVSDLGIERSEPGSLDVTVSSSSETFGEIGQTDGS